MEFIQAFKLTKSYNFGDRQVRILNANNFVVKEGDFVIILGNSGSGKTTLLNLISGLDQPTSGELHVMGDKISDLSPNELSQWRMAHVGVIFQDFNLIPFMSAEHNVALPLVFCGVSREQRKRRARALLKSVGLGNRLNHVPSQLSGGERQRVAISRALINNPKLLIADEPTGELDSKSANDVMTLLHRLNHHYKTTIIMATHNPSYVSYASRIIHIFDGHITSEETKR